MFIKIFFILVAFVVAFLVIDKACRVIADRRKKTPNINQSMAKCAHDGFHVFPKENIVNSKTSMLVCEKCGEEIGKINSGTKG